MSAESVIVAPRIVVRRPVAVAVQVALVVAAVVGVLLYCEYSLASMPNSHIAKRNGIEARAGDVEVLVLGSSHAFYGIDPAQFSRPGYNLANVSQDLYYDAAMLDKYIDRLTNLRLVILPISYFTMEFTVPTGDEAGRQYLYERFDGIPLEGASPIAPQRWSLMALYGKDATIEWVLEHKTKNPPLSDLGWATFVDRGVIDDEHGAAYVKRHNAFMHDEAIAGNMAHLRHMITLLQSRGVTVALVTTPTSNTYYKYMDERNYQQMQDCIAQLVTDYGVTYHDYLRDERFTTADYGDNDHLNARGAIKFSRMLDADVVQALTR